MRMILINIYELQKCFITVYTVYIIHFIAAFFRIDKIMADSPESEAGEINSPEKGPEKDDVPNNYMNITVESSREFEVDFVSHGKNDVITELDDNDDGELDYEPSEPENSLKDAISDNVSQKCF